MLRAFRTTFLFAIDEAEAVEELVESEGLAIENPPPTTLEEVKKYLDDALRLDVDTEGCGNPLGFQSAEVLIEELVELSPSAVHDLYEKE
jgi:hypothetical protein